MFVFIIKTKRGRLFPLASLQRNGWALIKGQMWTESSPTLRLNGLNLTLPKWFNTFFFTISYNFTNSAPFSGSTQEFSDFFPILSLWNEWMFFYSESERFKKRKKKCSCNEKEWSVVLVSFVCQLLTFTSGFVQPSLLDLLAVENDFSSPSSLSSTFPIFYVLHFYYVFSSSVWMSR